MHFTSRGFPSNTSNTSTSATTHFVDRRPPPPQKKWVAFKQFIWNKQERMFCGRTAGSWLKILVFYFIFLTSVVGMAVTLIEVASQHVKNNCVKIPCITKQDILYQASPGLSFEPNIIRSQSPLVWFGKNKTEKPTEYYIKYTEEFLKKYNQSNDTANCSFSKKAVKSCIINVEDLGPCAKSSYGYDENKPCIYIKLNKLPEWKPDFYTGHKLPDYIPNQLQTIIEEAENKNVLWLYCEGMTSSDVEHLGLVSYYPLQGYKEHIFSCDNYQYYLAPVVAIKLNHVKKGYSISISCSIWAKNVNNKDPKHYTTHIQLYIEHTD